MNHAIIGANYGDEGKGMMTDYFCSLTGADLVVRFSGGAQAGHTVVTPEGKRHVFHHYGSGSLLGVSTFLSEYFIVNPILFANEDITGVKVYVDPDAVVTTPMDMLVNQAYEKKVGRQASCGIGINETMRRSNNPKYRITVKDMLDRVTYDTLLEEYVPARIKELAIDLTIEPHWERVYFDHAYKFLDQVHVTKKPKAKNIIFEGSQGLCLSQNSRNFPHVTHAHTGIENVLRLCGKWGLKKLQTTYVTRSYFTRHGAGPLPGEKPLPKFVKDDTNITHEFQGKLRYAPLDIPALEIRIVDNARGMPFNVAITCMDQYEVNTKSLTLPVAFTSWGPTRKTMEKLL